MASSILAKIKAAMLAVKPRHKPAGGPPSRKIFKKQTATRGPFRPKMSADVGGGGMLPPIDAGNEAPQTQGIGQMRQRGPVPPGGSKPPGQSPGQPGAPTGPQSWVQGMFQGGAAGGQPPPGGHAGHDLQIAQGGAQPPMQPPQPPISGGIQGQVDRGAHGPIGHAASEPGSTSAQSAHPNLINGAQMPPLRSMPGMAMGPPGERHANDPEMQPSPLAAGYGPPPGIRGTAGSQPQPPPSPQQFGASMAAGAQPPQGRQILPGDPAYQLSPLQQQFGATQYAPPEDDAPRPPDPSLQARITQRRPVSPAEIQPQSAGPEPPPADIPPQSPPGGTTPPASPEAAPSPYAGLPPEEDQFVQQQGATPTTTTPATAPTLPASPAIAAAPKPPGRFQHVIDDTRRMVDANRARLSSGAVSGAQASQMQRGIDAAERRMQELGQRQGFGQDQYKEYLAGQGTPNADAAAEKLFQPGGQMDWYQQASNNVAGGRPQYAGISSHGPQLTEQLEAARKTMGSAPPGKTEMTGAVTAMAPPTSGIKESTVNFVSGLFKTADGGGAAPPFPPQAIDLGILGAGGAALGGMAGLGSLGATAGAPVGAIAGFTRGNTPEGLGRGIIRGGAAGVGAGVGGLAAGGGLAAAAANNPQLAQLMQDHPLIPAAVLLAGLGAGGIGGHHLSGQLLGPPESERDEKRAFVGRLFEKNAFLYGRTDSTVPTMNNAKPKTRVRDRFRRLLKLPLPNEPEKAAGAGCKLTKMLKKRRRATKKKADAEDPLLARMMGKGKMDKGKAVAIAKSRGWIRQSGKHLELNSAGRGPRNNAAKHMRAEAKTAAFVAGLFA
jgi:hypothetical protein